MAAATEAQFQAWEAALEEGLSPFEASRKAGTTLTGLKLGDRTRHADGLERYRDVTEGFVLDTLRSNVERAMQTEPVLDGKGEETGEFRYEGNVANKGLELLGRAAGMFVERRQIEHSGPGGGPIELEGRAVVGIAEVVEFYRAIGASADVGLDAGDSRRALPAAPEVLPDPAGDQRPAVSVPARIQS